MTDSVQLSPSIKRPAIYENPDFVNVIHVYNGQSIQAAINKVKAGKPTVILIHAGTYNGDISVAGKKNLKITNYKGQLVSINGDVRFGVLATKIAGGKPVGGMLLGSENVELEGLTINGRVSGSHGDIDIKNCELYGKRVGMWYVSCVHGIEDSNIRLENNEIISTCFSDTVSVLQGSFIEAKGNVFSSLGNEFFPLTILNAGGVVSDNYFVGKSSSVVIGNACSDEGNPVIINNNIFDSRLPNSVDIQIINSDPVLRRNHFATENRENLYINMNQLCNTPDIGTTNDHGLNIFNADYFRIILLIGEADLSFVGNIILNNQSYQEMQACPDYNSCNITKIVDGHDINAGPGLVDYSEAYPAP